MGRLFSSKPQVRQELGVLGRLLWGLGSAPHWEVCAEEAAVPQSC